MVQKIRIGSRESKLAGPLRQSVERDGILMPEALLLQ